MATITQEMIYFFFFLLPLKSLFSIAVLSDSALPLRILKILGGGATPPLNTPLFVHSISSKRLFTIFMAFIKLEGYIIVFLYTYNRFINLKHSTASFKIPNRLPVYTYSEETEGRIMKRTVYKELE